MGRWNGMGVLGGRWQPQIATASEVLILTFVVVQSLFSNHHHHHRGFLLPAIGTFYYFFSFIPCACLRISLCRPASKCRQAANYASRQ